MQRINQRTLLVSALGLGLAGLAWLVGYWWFGDAEPPRPTFVGSKTCASCHATQAREWTGSHHHQAMAEATAATVLGNFDEQQFTHQGVTSRLFRQGDKFFVTTEGPNGKPETYPVKFTFGVAPLQQYLIEFPGGRLQALSVAWDTEQQRWFHLYQDEKIPHHDWLHWTKGSQNWNHMCAECHSTNVFKNYDLATDRYHTTYAEINVTCESCHGPGSTHVELAKGSTFFRDRRWDPQKAYGLVPLRNARTQIESCAPCHARRGVIQAGHHAGRELCDHFAPELLDNEETYFADGQIRDEVYEYGSYLQSKMFRMGVRCSDCHNPHTAKPRAAGNELCVRCHTPAKYNVPAHHHHPPESKGALCVECHMPTRTYMVVHPRRDHSIRIPRPDLSVTLGTPNACTACHKDKKAEWARDQVVAWYGPRRPDDPHYAPALAAGRVGKSEGAALLLNVARRQDVGPIVRASALSLLGRYGDTATHEQLRRGLTDPEPLVRYGAIRGLQGRSAGELRESLLPLLDDPIRLVRTEAARLLTQVPAESLTIAQQQAFQRTFQEFEQGQLVSADQPGTHLSLGIVYENLGQPQRAEHAYRAALRLVPQFQPAYHNLALLQERHGESAAAERTYRELLRHYPDQADAHYFLGLLLAKERSRLREAAESLARAARLDPQRARIHYNLGLALQHLNRPTEAEASLRKAHQLEPTVTDYIHALAVLYLQQKSWSEARRWADELIRLEPDNRQWQELRRHILEPRP